MSDEEPKKYPEWMTIRIRGRVVERVDALIKQNDGSKPIPSTTARTDVIEAALETYAQSLGTGQAQDPEEAPIKIQKKPRRAR